MRLEYRSFGIRYLPASVVHCDERKEAMQVIRIIAPLVDNPNAPNPEGETLLEIAKQNEECYNEVFKIVNDSKNFKISRILNRLRKKRLNK